jgi:glycosyltransferase involved in cell wall biosynthesis
MRIAVEAWAAQEVPAGRGRYVRELLRAIRALDPEDLELVLLCREPWPGLDLGPRMRWRPVPGTGPVWTARAARVARAEADVLLATTSYALPALAPLPSVVVVYDFVAFDRALSPPAGSLLERLTLPPAVRRGRAFACISGATRDELVRRFPKAAGRAHVTLLAADDHFARAAPDPAVAARHGIDRPYVLSAATLEPRKNLPRLIEAFAALPPQLRDAHQLVLVGSRGWQTADLDASLERHRHLVHALGYVPDDELATLYAGAAVVAYVSLNEGFGLPVLEGMAAGAPVLTSDRSSMPEVGGDAAAYADPTSVASIRDALAALLTDPERRAALAAAGRVRAQGFSWERTARETLDLVRAVAPR